MGTYQVVRKETDIASKKSRRIHDSDNKQDTKQFEPRSEKTGLRGFRPGPIQTGLYSHRRWLEA